MSIPDVQIDIALVSRFSLQDRRALEEWFDQQFGHLPYEWAPPEWYAVARAGAELVGRLAIVTREVTVASQRIHVGGIGGVATRPERRLHGVATALLRRVAEFMKTDLGTESGFLLCRHEVAPVYAKVGWLPVAGPTHFMQSSGPQTYPRDTMVLPLTARPWPEGPIDLCGLPW